MLRRRICSIEQETRKELEKKVDGGSQKRESARLDLMEEVGREKILDREVGGGC